MQKKSFLEPVCVKAESQPDGMDILDLEHALRFLREWPENRRGPVYLSAFNACCAAHDGYLTIEEARASLVGFARITGILRKGAAFPAVARVGRSGARVVTPSR